MILGSGDVDPEILSKIIHSYYESKKKDRRNYKGKHRPTNSPMIIKLLQSKRR